MTPKTEPAQECAPTYLPTAIDRKRLSVAADGMDERTIVRAYRSPSSVQQRTLLQVERAARTLGLPEPTGNGTPRAKALALDEQPGDGASGAAKLRVV